MYIHRDRVCEVDTVPHAASQHTAMDEVKQVLMVLRLSKPLSDHVTAMCFDSFEACKTSSATKFCKRPYMFHGIEKITKCISKTAGESFIICRNELPTGALSNKKYILQHKNRNANSSTSHTQTSLAAHF